MKIRTRLWLINVSMLTLALWLIGQSILVSRILDRNEVFEYRLDAVQTALIQALETVNLGFHSGDTYAVAFSEQIDQLGQQLQTLQTELDSTALQRQLLETVRNELGQAMNQYRLLAQQYRGGGLAMPLASELQRELESLLLLQLQQTNTLRSSVQRSAKHLLTRLFLQSLAVYLLIGLMIVFFVGRMVRQIRRGMNWFSEITNQVQKGDLDNIAQDPFRGRDEFARLAGEFMAMIKGLRELTMRKSEIEQLVAQRTEELQSLTITDALTGALNRRGLESISATELSRARRTGQPLSVIMADIDLFKTVNDSHGHFAGDQMLVAVSRCIRSQMRDHDFLFRYGGEEFLLLMSGTTRQEALSLAERLCDRVRQLRVSVGGRTIRVTLSCGVATLTDATQSFERLVGCADDALYEAKNNGRDRCVAHDCHAPAAAGQPDDEQRPGSFRKDPGKLAKRMIGAVRPAPSVFAARRPPKSRRH